jgi:hypothetical protein
MGRAPDKVGMDSAQRYRAKRRQAAALQRLAGKGRGKWKAEIRKLKMGRNSARCAMKALGASQAIVLF